MKPILYVISCFVFHFNYTLANAQESDFSKKEALNTHFEYNLSVSYVKMLGQIDETMFTTEELVHEQRLNKGIQLATSLMYKVTENTFLGFTYSTMIGNISTALFHYDNNPWIETAQNRIHYVGPIINLRLQDLNEKLTCDLYCSSGLAVFTRKSTISNYKYKTRANLLAIELGVSAFYRITENISVGFTTGMNSGSFEKYKVIDNQREIDFSFENNNRNSIIRAFCGFSLRIY